MLTWDEEKTHTEAASPERSSIKVLVLGLLKHKAALYCAHPALMSQPVSGIPGEEVIHGADSSFEGNLQPRRCGKPGLPSGRDGMIA